MGSGEKGNEVQHHSYRFCLQAKSHIATATTMEIQPLSPTVLLKMNSGSLISYGQTSTKPFTRALLFYGYLIPGLDLSFFLQSYHYFYFNFILFYF